MALDQVELKASLAEQKKDFLSGNEMAALAAAHINFHVMCY